MTEWPCAECGGAVELRSGRGRTALYRRGLSLPIPAELVIPTCTRCGETFVDGDLEEAFSAALETAYREWQAAHVAALVACLGDRHNASQRQIANICDVTPSHLTHVIKGTGSSSVMFQRFLEALVVCPSEFQRHLDGQPFERRALMRAAYESPAQIWGFQARPRWTSAALETDTATVANDVAA
jgi:hypothetical protein